MIGALLLVGGLALVLWGADRFTDGASGTAARFALSPFWVGVVVSGFEPENLVTGIAAAAGALPQVALGTVIGSAVFMLTGGLGVAQLLVPMEVRIPRAGAGAMLGSAAAFVLALWNDGAVSRVEGALLVLLAIGLMAWLYRRSPVFRPTAEEAGEEVPPAQLPGVKAVGWLIVGLVVMLAGAELVVQGAGTLVGRVGLSETFIGMTVVGMGESLEETARMVAPARRGHPELAWGNVVGTVVVLLAFNLGVIALVRPLAADPLVLRFHAPFLTGCTLLVALALLWARKLGRGFGALLVGMYLLYLGVNLSHMWG